MKELKEQLIKDVIIRSHPIQMAGGQSCHKMTTGISLTCESTGFKISIDYHRSQFMNRELALTLYLLFLDEVIK